MSSWEEVRALFTEQDVAHMRFMFDLSDCHAVAAHADEINKAVNASPMSPNLMPPESSGGPWDAAKKETLKSWIDAGKPCQ